MYQSYCGIDFGTTNSAVSVSDEQKNPQLVEFENHKKTIPTAIFFPEENTYSPLYGTPAIANYIEGSSGRFMRSLKRIFGTDLMDLKTEVNEIRLSYEEIILQFMKYLKKTAESQIKTELTSVVLGRPVHFQDFAPEADSKAESMLQRIAIKAGFKNVSFQFEPLAAAYAHESALKKEQLACVIDIGGGTSDFSLIKLGPENKKKTSRQSDILANTGIRVGGNDFDRDLSIKCFMPDLGYGTDLKPDDYNGRILPIPFSPYTMLSEWSSVNNLYTYKEKKNIEQIYKRAAEPEKVRNLYEVVKRELGHTLLNEIENCKIALTNNHIVNQRLAFLPNVPEIKVGVEEFEQAIMQDTKKVTTALAECLHQGGVSKQNVDLVVLTGGSTEIPYIKKCIRQLFPSATISEDDKLVSVAAGLSYDAMKRYGVD